MCNSKVPLREEVIIAQNAAAGDNRADVQQLQAHISTTNILLAIILFVFAVVALLGAYHLYKRCHKRQIHRELHRSGLRGSFGWRRTPRLGFEGVRFEAPKRGGDE